MALDSGLEDQERAAIKPSGGTKDRTTAQEAENRLRQTKDIEPQHLPSPTMRLDETKTYPADSLSLTFNQVNGIRPEDRINTVRPVLPGSSAEVSVSGQTTISLRGGPDMRYQSPEDPDKWLTPLQGEGKDQVSLGTSTWLAFLNQDGRWDGYRVGLSTTVGPTPGVTRKQYLGMTVERRKLSPAQS